MDGIDISALLAGGGPWAIVALGLVAILRGDLVTRKTHESLIAGRDKVIVDTVRDRDYWRSKSEEQTTQLLDVFANQATQSILRAGLQSRVQGTQQ